MEDIARGPIDELYERLSFVADRHEPLEASVSKARAEVVLGANDMPILDLEGLYDEILMIYEDKLLHKSEEQIRTWAHPRIRAITNLIGVIGNKPIEEVSRDDAWSFRSWWLKRVKAGEVKQGTANKDMENLRAMFGAVIKARQWEDVKNVWSNMTLEEDEGDDETKRLSLTREEAINCKTLDLI